jgi:hypothetical protein
MQQTQQSTNSAAVSNKVDVHLLHMPEEINTIGDLDDPHIVVHHLNGIVDGILKARTIGFNSGTEPYVSFVDPDDEVNLSAFKQCIDVLDANPHLGGVYTNSTIIHFRDHVPDKVKYRDDHEWSLDWMKTSTPVHQLMVGRREIVTQAINNIPAELGVGRTALAEQLIYAHMAVLAPFQFINIQGYTWYCRRGAAHSRSRYDEKERTRAYIARLIDENSN